MLKQRPHPTPEELSAFSLGQLRPEAAAAVESHISDCRPCCETLLGLSSGDTFVALLQEARQGEDDPTFDQDGQVDRAPPPPGVPAELVEHPRYEILGLIGRGGMGDVFQARHRMMDRTVALKVINRDLVRSAEAVERFHREVKTAARLAHPHIVTAYDAEQAGEAHFLVMEHVDGIDLARLVAAEGALPIATACDYGRQAAIGLQYAHEQGMVHRDIKPHNLMVTSAGTVKILDFGLASLAPTRLATDEPAGADGSLTAAGAVMGTPDFISPEQADNARQADIRSDIYSLGATLYFLLSGRTPFAEGSVSQKLKSHAQLEPAPIQTLRGDVPPELAEIVRWMLAKDPAERFQTPADVAEALAPLPFARPCAIAGEEGSGRDGRTRAPQNPSGSGNRLAAYRRRDGASGRRGIYLATNRGTVVIRTEGCRRSAGGHQAGQTAGADRRCRYGPDRYPCTVCRWATMRSKSSASKQMWNSRRTKFASSAGRP
jgi:serine/threonine protein kinase